MNLGEKMMTFVLEMWTVKCLHELGKIPAG